MQELMVGHLLYHLWVVRSSVLLNCEIFIKVHQDKVKIILCGRNLGFQIS